MAWCVDAQLLPLVALTQHKIPSPWREVPKPLHIAKRSAVGEDNRVPDERRNCSQESEASGNNSIDSLGGLWETHEPLTLPKKRGDRGGWAVYHAVGCTQSRNRDPEIADGWIQLISGRVCAHSAYANQIKQLHCWLVPPS